MSTMKLDEHGVYRLIQEVVRQSSRDWRDAMRSLRKNPFNMNASQMALDCERFFISDYFFLLTGTDGEKFLDNLGRKYGFDA